MAAPILVLSPRYTPDSNALWGAALRSGWQVERLQNHRAPEWLHDQEVVIYGEGLFATVIADQLNLTLIQTAPEWLPTLPFEYRLRDVQLTTFHEAHAIQERAFIKPAIEKAFDAKIYESGADLPSEEWFDPEMPVLIAAPVEWEIEYRCFVADREIQTFSPYLRAGNLLKNDEEVWQIDQPENEAMLDFARRLLHDETILIPAAFVLDIGLIRDKGWAVIEANPAWASGIYGCNPDNVLNVLKRSCVKHATLP